MNAEPLFYWIKERHAIWTKRKLGLPKPWTQDPILQNYRFCNVFRELDTVTEWVRENWREPYAEHPNLWFAMCVARQINWPETLHDIRFPTKTDDEGMRQWMDDAVSIMKHRSRNGQKVYTGAYMIRGDIQGGYRDKPSYTFYKVLRPVWEHRKGFFELFGQHDLLDSKFSFQPTLQEVHKWLMQFPGWGGFMAYEVVTDLRHTRYLRNAPDIMTWANAGPGAIRGLNRIHGRPLNYLVPTDQSNREMRELLELSHERLRDADVPKLEMRDIEHSLCEMDKYLRVKNGEGRPRARYNGRG